MDLERALTVVARRPDRLDEVVREAEAVLVAGLANRSKSVRMDAAQLILAAIADGYRWGGSPRPRRKSLERPE